MTRKYGKAHLIQRATEEGYFFREFSLVNVGRHAADDADWNYKDIPHLHHVHDLAEAIPSMMGDDFVTTLNTQKVLGMKIPLTVVNYETGPGEQTYYSTIFWFILIIQTKFHEIQPLETEVRTTYSVGMPWLLQWTFPFLRWTITRNYRVLMKSDVPMRERRGALRVRGFGFLRNHATYSFADTTLLTRQNVVAPVRPPDKPMLVADLSTIEIGTEALLGWADDTGIRAKRVGNQVHLFPRICPHEGSCLDDSAVEQDAVRCPWHGRRFPAVCAVDLDDSKFHGEYFTAFSRIMVDGPTIALYPLVPVESPVRKITDGSFESGHWIPSPLT